MIRLLNLFALTIGLLVSTVACRSSQNKNEGTNEGRVANLEQQIKELTEKSKEATVVRSVSQQLEEIAYEQKTLSDEQRQEALFQKQKADEMRSLAELENEHAQLARSEALDAYRKMEEQKVLADLRREEAIQAQLKTDTLARLALGRSLAIQSIGVFEVGNTELAKLLASLGWQLTLENKGDIYQSALFEALNTVSNSEVLLPGHRGAVRDLYIMNSQSDALRFVSVSEWGELLLWDLKGDNRIPQTLYSNSKYDLRKVSYDSIHSNFVAATFDGYLLIVDEIDPKNHSVVDMIITEVTGMAIAGRHCYLSSKKGEVVVSELSDYSKIGKLNIKKVPQIKTLYTHSNPITFLKVKENRIIIGDDKGLVIELSEEGKVLSETNVGEGAGITSLALFQKYRLTAYGLTNGTIRIYRDGKKVSELIGHLSRITGLVWDADGLISASTDCTLRFWKPEPVQNKSMIIATAPGWIYCMAAFDEGRQTIISGAPNQIQLRTISQHHMAEQIQQSISRDFTQEEWTYYIGAVTAFRHFKSKD